MLRAWLPCCFIGVCLALACSSTPEQERQNSGGAGGTGGTSGSSGGTSGGSSGSAGSSGGTGGGNAGSAGSGGNGGSSGSAGSAGSAGTAGSAGSGGSSGSGGGSGSAIVVDDFESETAGSAPDPALFSVGGPGMVQISSEQAHGGTQSVKVVGTGNATMFSNATVFPLPAGIVHFRVWMRFANADWSGHVGFVAAGPGAESEEVRFGGMQGAYHANLAADGDGLSPDPWAQPSCEKCLAPVANEWACVRGMFDFTNSKAQLYVGDTLAVDAEKDSVKNDWHSGTGTLPSNPTKIGFGWALYGGVENTVYYDDLAIGYEPIPCQ